MADFFFDINADTRYAGMILHSMQDAQTVAQSQTEQVN